MSSSSSLLTGSIHGDPNYVNFTYTFNLLTAFLLISYCYVFITILICLKMIRRFLKPGVTSAAKHVQNNVFWAFIWMQAANLLFYILDNLVFRIPPSGLLTSWLAASYPEVFMKLSYYLLLNSNYLSTSFSFLFCLIRFLVVHYPDSHRRKISKLFCFYIPISFILPLLFTSYFISGTVTSIQMSPPYRFGAVYFRPSNTWLSMHFDPFNLSINFVTTISIIGINVALLRKIRVMMKKRVNQRSTRSFKSEISLTLMTLTMNIPFLATAGMTMVGIIDFTKAVYTLLPRQFASDVGLVAVPWIFYLTHPMFRKKSTVSISMSQGSSGMRMRGSAPRIIVN